MSKTLKQKLVAYALVLPAFLVVMLTVAYPIVSAVIQSFQDEKTGAFTLANYAYFFTEPAQRMNILYTLFVVIATVVIALVVAHPAVLKSIVTNCAVLGAAKTNISNGYSFIGSLVYGVAAGVGYTLAIVLFASIRERLDATSKCPKCFEGFPISLVAAALLAMSFMGFSGLSIW